MFPQAKTTLSSNKRKNVDFVSERRLGKRCWYQDLVGLDFFLFEAVKSKLSLINGLVIFLLFGFDILWMSRPWLIETGKFLECRDWDSSRLRNFLDAETETQRDWEISWMLRPRLTETGKFLRCQDWDSSRLRNFLDVETKTHQDWEI